MNKIDTTQASDPGKRQPWSVRSLQFIQDAYKEAIGALAQGLTGDSYSSSVGYAIYNGKRASAISATIEAGFFYFNGEVYYFPGIGGYTGFSNTGVYVLVTTNGTPDPITFTDNSQSNVHNVRRLNLVDQANGTGLFNFNEVVYTHAAPVGITVGSGGSAPAFGTNWAQQLAVVFRKNNQNMVTIQGIARNTVGNTGTIFTLPVGYRPVTAARNCTGMVLYSTTDLVTDFINISTGGAISISGFNTPGSFSAADVYFNISFYAD